MGSRAARKQKSRTRQIRRIAMNRKQVIVLCVGIAALVEWYLATKNVDHPIGALIAVGVIAAVITGGLFYILRDKIESRQDNNDEDTNTPD